MKGTPQQKTIAERELLMDIPTTDFVRAGSLEELKAKGRLVVHGPHRPILVVHDKGRVFALDNRCLIWAFPWIAAASRTAP